MKSVQSINIMAKICIFLTVAAFSSLFSCSEKAKEPVHGRLEIRDNSKSTDSIFGILKSLDSLMFEESYNKLNSDILKELATEDIEFYHDQSGATYNRSDFIEGMKGLGNLSYKARRELIPGTTQIFPLSDNGKIYAAILMAEHRFYAREANEKPEYLTSTAKYTTLWILSEGEWKMSRIYSYDHQSPSE